MLLTTASRNPHNQIRVFNDISGIVNHILANGALLDIVSRNASKTM